MRRRGRGAFSAALAWALAAQHILGTSATRSLQQEVRRALIARPTRRAAWAAIRPGSG